MKSSQNTSLGYNIIIEYHNGNFETFYKPADLTYNEHQYMIHSPKGSYLGIDKTMIKTILAIPIDPDTGYLVEDDYFDDHYNQNIAGEDDDQLHAGRFASVRLPDVS